MASISKRMAVVSWSSTSPVDLFLRVAELGHLDRLPDVLGAQDHGLRDVAGEVRVLAQLPGDDLPGHLQELLLGIGLEVETDEPGQELWRQPIFAVDASNHVVFRSTQSWLARLRSCLCHRGSGIRAIAHLVIRYHWHGNWLLTVALPLARPAPGLGPAGHP